ncbi:MAG: hypothetical protein KJ606_01135, partial [Chloroflexi bacterium]|nr:hypothetical protein [Chloroflexota bacterium]
LPYPPSEQYYSIMSRKELTPSVTFSFEATLPPKLLFILRHYVLLKNYHNREDFVARYSYRPLVAE